MSFSAFDSQWDNQGVDSQAMKPYFTVADQGEKKILEWLTSKFAGLVGEASPAILQAKKFMRLIEGKTNADSTQSLEDTMLGRTKFRRPQSLIINHPWDLVEQRIAIASRFRPAVSVTPATADYQDRVSAQIVKTWLEFQAYIHDEDLFFQAMARLAYTTGEAFVFVDWDDRAGDYLPAWLEEQKEAALAGTKPGVPYFDSQGKPVLDEFGAPKLINKPIMQGDIKTVLLSLFDVFPVRKPDFKDCTEFFRIKWRDSDELKRELPEFAAKIQPNASNMARFDPVAMNDRRPSNEVMVLVYEHMPDEFVPDGCVIECLPQVILSHTPYYAHGKQPYVRFTDLELPGFDRGISFLKNIKPLSQTINDITSMTRRSYLLCAHPKWAVPMNSVVKKEQLGNDTGIVEYKGSEKPTIINSPVIPPDYFTFRESLVSEMNQLATINDVTRGNVPKRVDSGIALQYLDEQSNERANVSILKYQRAIRDTYQLKLAVASKKYQKDDGRLIPLMGASQRYEVQQFDPTHLNKPLHIRFESASALPQSRAIRTQSIIDLKQSFPTMLSDRAWLDLLEFGQEERVYDIATVALRAAESKVQDLLLGKPVPPPQKHEDLLTVREVTVREMQTRDFSTNIPPQIVQGVHDFLMQTECLLFERAVTNPILAQALGQLPDFPLEFVPSPEQMMAIGRSAGPSIMPAAVNPTQSVLPAGDATADPNAGAPGQPSLPPPQTPQPTDNTIPGGQLPPLPQPPQ